MSDLIERLRLGVQIIDFPDGYVFTDAPSANLNMKEAADQLEAQKAEIARLRLALFAIESKCLDCETINLIGSTCEAKIAGALRNVIKIAGSALENAE